MSIDARKPVFPSAARDPAASKLWRSVKIDGPVSSNRPRLLRRQRALFEATRATVLEVRHNGVVTVLHAGCPTAALALGVGAHFAGDAWEIGNDNALPDAVRGAAEAASSQHLAAQTTAVLRGVDHEVVATPSGDGVLCVLRASPVSPAAAHDLNNCLTAVACAAGALLDDASLSDDARSLATIVHEALRRAGALTRQLLSQAHHERSPADVVDLGRELLAMTPLLRRALPPSVRFVAEIDPDMPSARLLAGHLQRIVMNLVSNAGRAVSDHGEITLSAWGDASDGGPVDRAMIEVIDDGCGMSPEVFARAFEAGFTSHADKGGHGLGLSTVRAMIQESGGAITIESREGHGTRVLISLPAWVPRVSQTLDARADNDG